MFGMGWSELLVVGIVALVVVGPKELPGLFRTMGQFTGKAKGMAREFNKAMNAAADEAGVKDISKTINAAANPKAFGVDKIREATGMKPGGATEALAKERAANKAKVNELLDKAGESRAEAMTGPVTSAPAKPLPKAAPVSQPAKPESDA